MKLTKSLKTIALTAALVTSSCAVGLFQPNKSLAAVNDALCAQTDTLCQGDTLRPGQYLVSGNGIYKLQMQSDGNFVLYHSSTRIWSSGTNGKTVYQCVMQLDGNLVLYTTRYQLPQNAVWASGSTGSLFTFQPYYLTVQNDGNVVIKDANNNVIWATGTNGR